MQSGSGPAEPAHVHALAQAMTGTNALYSAFAKLSSQPNATFGLGCSKCYLFYFTVLCNFFHMLLGIQGDLGVNLEWLWNELESFPLKLI